VGGASLTANGPGAWSLDALLFGRKHFEIPRR
jgi:putative oxidoreductase